MGEIESLSDDSVLLSITVTLTALFRASESHSEKVLYLWDETDKLRPVAFTRAVIHRKPSSPYADFIVEFGDIEITLPKGKHLFLVSVDNTPGAPFNYWGRGKGALTSIGRMNIVGAPETPSVIPFKIGEWPKLKDLMDLTVSHPKRSNSP